MFMIKKIAVIGAGTSGWLVASAIKKNCPEIDVTLVYDSRIPTVGVGETLAFSTPQFFKEILGLQDEQWMNKIQATYKTGLSLPGWTSKDSKYQSAHTIDFPAKFLLRSNYENIHQMKFFADSNSNDEYARHGGIVDLWCSMYQNGLLDDATVDDVMAANSELYYFSKNRKSIRSLTGEWYTNPVIGYSYHYNAELVGSMVGDLVGKPSGVVAIDSKVIGVQVTNGTIESISLENGTTITADLFVDCSGFNKILVKQMPFTWVAKDEFYNNSALVAQVYYDDVDNKVHQISTNTTLAGMDAGWRNSIPLQNRSGNAYIFNKNIQTDVDKIADEFKTALGVDQKNFRQISWDSGHNKEAIVGNCFSLGLASGFTDPFDANNLMLAMHMIKEIIPKLKQNASLSDITSNLNKKFWLYWQDIDMRVQSFLRLSPRRDTPHYQLMAEVAEQTNLKERFLDHIEQIRKRDFANQQNFLWRPWTYVTLAMRYGIRLPDVDLSLAPIGQKFFELNKLRCKAMSDQAPSIHEYYPNQH